MALITSGCVPFRYCLTGTSVYKKQELGLDKQLRCAAAAAAAALGSFGLHGTFFGGCVLRSNRPTDLEGPGLCRQQQLMLAGKKGAGGGKGYELQNEDEVCLPPPPRSSEPPPVFADSSCRVRRRGRAGTVRCCSTM